MFLVNYFVQSGKLLYLCTQIMAKKSDIAKAETADK